MPTLYIIDAYAQFFRAYHAIRAPMTSPVTREPTNMTYGFAGMLLKLLRGREKNMGGPPDYLAVALDVSGDRGTFRSELYPEYKATRPPPPEDLFPQVTRCLAILDALRVPTIGVEGFEADDVIASLIDQLRRENPDLKVRIISKDKDLKQLLADGGRTVELYDVHTDTVANVETLRKESDITPEQVVDMLTLMGDTVDNIPGVEGVGPKTAAQLIARYGSLENLLAHADEIKGKRGERLREAAPRLALSRTLVTLRHDVEVEFDLARAQTRSFDAPALLPIFRELGFNAYQDQLKEMLGPEAAAMAPTKAAAREAPIPGGLFDAAMPEPCAVAGEYECVTTPQALAAVVSALEKSTGPISVDTETTAILPMFARLCGISLAIEEGRGWYIPVCAPDHEPCLEEGAVLDALRPVLEDPARPKLGHNLKYDLLILRNAGLELRGVEHEDACDSLIAAFLIDPTRSSHSLDALALALLGRTNMPIKDLIGTGKNQRTFDTVPLAQAAPYAAEDADVSLQLCAKMCPQLRAMGLMDLFHDVEMPLVSVLAELEWNGILVDPRELDHQRDRLQTRIDELCAHINDVSMSTIGRTFNPDSPRQLAGALFNKPEHADSPGLGITPLKRTKTGYSTDVEVLEKLAANPAIESTIPSLIVEHRQLTKLVGTYLVSLKEAIHPKTGRIHASFHQTGAATGRLSSSDPNLQNIPIRTQIGREIRKAFVAPEGHVLISADYSQVELRLLAHLSRDPALIQAFVEGRDIHVAVAAEIHGVGLDDVTREQRDGAKMVNFGIVYGITAFGLARRLGISNTQAEEIIAGYKSRFSGITTFLQECVDQARRFGYVETMLKRRRPIPDIDSRNGNRRALAERMAINSVVQGSAADLIKIAMVDLHRRLSPHAAHVRRGAAPEIENVRMLLQIHDELVFEAPESSAEAASKLITERMERAMKLSVPLAVDVSIGKNWYSK